MDDKELVALLKQRDQRGLDALAQQYGPLLRYVIAPILEDRREREECLSDLHLLVWEKIGGYDRTKGSLSAWLSALARNTARNRRRDETRGNYSGQELDPSMVDPKPGPEEVLLRKERAQRLQQAAERLGDIDRSLFYRKYYYLQSTAQMAAELGFTERAVEGRLHRLRKRLRKELGGELDD